MSATSVQSRTRMTAPCAAQLAPAIAERASVGSSAVTAATTASANRRIIGDQDRLRRFVVLRLGQQIDRDATRVVVAGGDHHDLRRAGDVVDADAAEHLTLGLGDIGVAGTDDAVHRRIVAVPYARAATAWAPPTR